MESYHDISRIGNLRHRLQISGIVIRTVPGITSTDRDTHAPFAELSNRHAQRHGLIVKLPWQQRTAGTQADIYSTRRLMIHYEK